MLFSSAVFLFAFLPICLSSYYVFGASNLVLLVFGLIFYAWGEPILVLVLLGSIAVNFVFGRLIESSASLERRRELAVFFGISFNLILLGFFKYTDFLIAQLNDALAVFAMGQIPQVHIPLPLGISFFTFQSMSYLVDVYRRDCPAEKSVLTFALFKTLFPQLIAGPIVRYTEIKTQLVKRNFDLALFADGIERLVTGLAQKVIVADVLAVSVDKIFALAPGETTFITSWAGVILFMLQIYFDFSGYSNMAIGLSQMLGFRIPENFNFPYAAESIREFWRRWHMTLSRWFRDYVYFPLGGNRKGGRRTLVNLVIVFLLCGLWHGANWTFVVWGLYHGLFLALERTRFWRALQLCPKVLRHTYVLIVLAVGWLVFRSPSIESALDMGKAMLGANGFSNPQFALRQFADNLTFLVAVVAALFSCPRIGLASLEWLRADGLKIVSPLARALGIGALFVISLSFVGAQTHRAFIYFRF